LRLYLTADAQNTSVSQPQDTPPRSLFAYLRWWMNEGYRWAIVFWGTIGVLYVVFVWHPWGTGTSATTTTSAASSCQFYISGVNSPVHVEARGVGADIWCADFIDSPATAGRATVEPVSITTYTCDYYKGPVHVYVYATDPFDATNFCAAFGVTHLPQPT
jgi:hypothetical protein